jgi:hypothetical protein
MNRRQGRTVVVVGGVAAVLFLLPLFIVRVSHFPMGRCMLSAEGIRRAVLSTTGKNLPETVEAAQGMIDDARDMGAFVRFHTDEAGIEHVLRTFQGFYAKTETLNEKQLRNWSGFHAAERWQKERGVRVYDPNTIRSATVISGSSSPDSPKPDTSYIVLIDLERGDVYVLGMQT